MLVRDLVPLSPRNFHLIAGLSLAAAACLVCHRLGRPHLPLYRLDSSTFANTDGRHDYRRCGLRYVTNATIDHSSASPSSHHGIDLRSWNTGRDDVDWHVTCLFARRDIRALSTVGIDDRTHVSLFT